MVILAFTIIVYAVGFWSLRAWFYLCTTVIAYVLTDMIMEFVFGPGKFGRFPIAYFSVAVGILMSSLLAEYVAQFLFSPTYVLPQAILGVGSLFVAAAVNVHVKQRYME